jgi:hypothetical protein
VEDEMSEEDSGGRKESALRNKGILCHVWCSFLKNKNLIKMGVYSNSARL